MIKDWYEKSIKALQLNGSKASAPQEAYTRAVHMLADFYHKTPDRVTEEDLQHYFLHRRNVGPVYVDDSAIGRLTHACCSRISKGAELPRHRNVYAFLQRSGVIR